MIAAEPEVADSQSADVQIRSDFTAPFEAWPAPPDGYLVAARTWDFGPFPKAWVERIEADYDRLWVHTQWIREQAVASGIPPERVAVVPLGVDPDVFQPDGPAMRLPGGRRPKPFTFLFVGAPVMRKGFDVLLRAWALAFRRTSGVRLVVKANPRDVFYAGARQIELLHALRRDADAAPVEFIDRHLPAARLAALYRAADVAVFPYRAEGFCLPILEAMACGTPVIAPRFGAALDFCSEASSWLVPARRIAVPVNRTFAFNTLGFTQEIDAVDFCEVPADALADLMRDVAAADPRARARKATRGLAVARRFTWAASVNAIAKDLALISRQGPPRRFRQSRDSAEAHRRTLKIAETLYRRGSRL